MRTKVLTGLLVVGLAVGLAAAQKIPTKKMVRLQGWVVDEWCGEENAKAERKDDTLECHKKGAALVFYDDDTGDIYKVNKQEEAEKFVGRKVGVFGVMDAEGNLAVGQFFDIKKKPKPEEKDEGE